MHCCMLFLSFCCCYLYQFIPSPSVLQGLSLDMLLRSAPTFLFTMSVLMLFCRKIRTYWEGENLLGWSNGRDLVLSKVNLTYLLLSFMRVTNCCPWSFWYLATHFFGTLASPPFYFTIGWLNLNDSKRDKWNSCLQISMVKCWITLV